jgi:N-acyl-D-aspartate/D-glutamate deacylase
MAQDFELIVRGGTVLDGTGSEAYTADVGVRDGRIAAVGHLEGQAPEVVDADGLLVTPGFVDIHTHYDGQVTWDSQVVPSAWHGVTTVVMGNCGVGFAPVRVADRDRLIELMEGVEDIPGAALHEGISWEWETFAEYLDAVDRRPHDIDVAAQVPHGAVRLYAMGERGAERAQATGDEIDHMGAIVRDAVRAGALGFTTSRTLNHRTSRGQPTPTLTAAEEELVGIAAAMGETGAGVIELISDFDEIDTEFSRLRRMVEVSGRPLTLSLSQIDGRPDRWRDLLDRIEEAAADGLDIRGQVAVRPIGLLLGLQATLNPFLTNPVYREVRDLPLEERVAVMGRPEFRDRLLEAATATDGRRFVFGQWDKMFPLGDPPDYEPDPSESLAARAGREGRSPEAIAYELLLADEGRAFLYFPLFNYTESNLDVARQMLVHDRTLIGLADGGAHVGTICDASFPTTLLSHWGRDRHRGAKLPLPWLVKAHTSDNARAVGLGDRGVIKPGYRADLNVIDFDRVQARRPEMAFDLPAGGKRLLQRADGYVATLVAGNVVYRDGEHTGALPGRLIRGPQPTPTG